jgi:Ca2+-binding EF-hand superfamily protein
MDPQTLQNILIAVSVWILLLVLAVVDGTRERKRRRETSTLTSIVSPEEVVYAELHRPANFESLCDEEKSLLQLKEAFALLDVGKDSTVSRDEFKKGISKLGLHQPTGPHPTPPPGGPPPPWDPTPHAPHGTPPLAGLHQPTGSAPGWKDDAFDRFDADGDGVINFQEMCFALGMEIFSARARGEEKSAKDCMQEVIANLQAVQTTAKKEAMKKAVMKKEVR